MSKVIEQLISIIIPIVIIVPFLISGCNRYNVPSTSVYEGNGEDAQTVGSATRDADNTIADEANMDVTYIDAADVTKVSDTDTDYEVDSLLVQTDDQPLGALKVKSPFVAGSKIFDESL